MKHPWLEKFTADENRVRSGSFMDLKVAEQMSKWTTKTGLIQTAIEVIAQSFTPDKIEHFRKEFESLDTNGDGVLSITEWTEALKGTFSEASAHRLFHDIDSDGSGTISYSEFVAAALTKKEYLTKNYLKLAFARMDTDNSGTLCVSDLVDLMIDDNNRNESHERRTTEQIMSMFRQHGFDENAQLNFDQFTKLMKEEEKMHADHAADHAMAEAGAELESADKYDINVADATAAPAAAAASASASATSGPCGPGPDSGDPDKPNRRKKKKCVIL